MSIGKCLIAALLAISFSVGACAEVLFQDNFFSGSRTGWEDITAGRPWTVFSITGGKVFGSNYYDTYTRVKNFSLGDYVFEADELSIGPGGGNDGGIFIRQQGTNDQNLVLLLLQGTQVLLVQRVNGVYGPGGAAGWSYWSDGGNHTGQPAHIRIAAFGQSFYAYVEAADGSGAY
ncbi:MAG: hypothetical protein AAB356_05575, partial [Deltaproteobacteria bacterium]